MKGLSSRYRARSLCSDTCITNCYEAPPLCRPVDIVAVKGRKEATTVYELITPGVCSQSKEMLEEACQVHAKALESYKAKRFSEALQLFDASRVIFEGSEGRRDEPCRLLMARCEQYLREPPPATWDGVDRLTAKTFAPPPAETSTSAGSSGAPPAKGP